MSDKYNVILEAATLSKMRPDEIIAKLKQANYADAETAANGDMYLAHDLSLMDAMDVEQRLSLHGLEVKVRKVGYVEPTAKPKAPEQEDLSKKDKFAIGGIELSLEPSGDEKGPSKAAVGSLKPCPSCGFRQMVQLHCVKCSAPMDG